MPLLNKKPLEKSALPEGVPPNELVYFCEATEEVFPTYDQFFDRMMELNSTVWTCELTNRSGLTFFEAIDSEKDALKTLESFPVYLELPILWIVQELTCRGRFEDLLNDVYGLMKDRYFLGEEVVVFDGGVKQHAQVTSVKCDAEEIPPQETKKEMLAPPFDSYTYTVQLLEVRHPDDSGLRDNLPSTALSRINKRILSRNNLKLFLKNTCVIKRGERYEVKERYLRDHALESRLWTDLIAGPMPIFPRTPMLQRGRQAQAAKSAEKMSKNGMSEHDSSKENAEESPGQTPTTPKTPKTPRATRGDASPTKKKQLAEKRKADIRQQQAEHFILFEKARRIGIDVEKYQQEERLLSKKEIEGLQERIKEARRIEREANALKKKQQQDWTRKRDDLDCDDLKPMPALPRLPLPEWIDDEMFSQFLTILQFFNTFSELLPIKEIRGTSRLTLSDVVFAIRCADPQHSTYASLMQILLQARADICDEEEGDEADMSRRDELVVEQNPDYEHPEHGDAIREMTQVHEEVRYTFGCAARNLVTDWMTLTEVLRYLLLTSGYVCRPAVHRHRLFARGSIRLYEDPAYMYRQEHPEVLLKLETGTVYDLEPQDRCDLMQVVMQQLLSYAKFRNFASERIEEIVVQRRELKKLRCWDVSQENDAKEARLLREMEAEGGEVPPRNKPSKETMKLKSMLKAHHDSKRYDKAELERILLETVAWDQLNLDEIVTSRELQRELVTAGMDKLRATIFEMTATCGSCTIGRDRAFRHFILMEQVPLLLVENPGEADRIGECKGVTPCMNKGDFATEEDWREAVMGCSGNPGTCVVHGENRQQRNRWSYIDSPELLEEVLAACNPRGFREIDLTAEIDYVKPQLVEMLEKTAKKVKNGDMAAWCLSGIEDPDELADSIDWPHEMKELILELELKMTEGLLGRLPEGIDRNAWRQMLTDTKDVTPLINGDFSVESRGGETEVVWTHDQLSTLSELQKLAIAFLQVVMSINNKFIKKPFSRVAPGCVIDKTTTMYNWERSVVECKSISALALHLYSIEPHIKWENSKTQAKCRVCRRKGQSDNLLLCLECDRCYHISCAKPPLKEVVAKWICHDCSVSMKRAQDNNKIAVSVDDGESSVPNGNGHDVSVNDENESTLDSVSSFSNSVVQTASGRKVKRVEYNIDRLTSLAPPPRKRARESSVSVRATPSESATEEEETEEETESEMTPTRTPRTPRTRRPTRKVDESFNSNRSFTHGLRDADPNFKEKLKKLEDVIRLAMRETYAWPFMDPVDVKDVPDYRDIVKFPMDLRTMINKMKNHDYDTIEQVRDDANLIVDNCKLYNEDTSEIYDCAERLADFWIDNLVPVFNDEKNNRRKRY